MAPLGRRPAGEPPPAKDDCLPGLRCHGAVLQVGGYATVYSGPHDFTFATVFNAGHMVPEDKPVEALALFKRFTYPEAGGRVDWNPAPEIALHIASQEPAPADAEAPFALAPTATASPLRDLRSEM